MRILWITNVPLPEASLLLGHNPLPYGGWLINAAHQLSKVKNIKLEIAFPYGGIREVKALKGERHKYYAFSNCGSEMSDYINQDLLTIIERSKPDLVHIYGTEFPHTLAMVNVCAKKDLPCVISIQGLVSFIAKHYLNGLPYSTQNHFTLRDFLRLDNIKLQQKKLIVRGKYEMEALQKVKHVIGRTNWDNACTKIINSTIHYHHCDETLRSEFYKHTWEFSNCEPYSIFISQGSYPIKGLHFILEALPLIIRRFPSAKLYIGGLDMTKTRTLKQKLRVSSYGIYIKKLIKKYELNEKVIFTGVLAEKEMCQRYIKSHVFVCPSTIENSPNSLGEAMLLGVPSVAANVGGITDLLTHKEEGYIYQTDAPYMLAYYICEIFEDRQLAERFSRNARKNAEKRYNKKANLQRLIEIYQVIFKGVFEESVLFEEEKVSLY